MFVTSLNLSSGAGGDTQMAISFRGLLRQASYSSDTPCMSTIPQKKCCLTGRTNKTLTTCRHTQVPSFYQDQQLTNRHSYSISETLELWRKVCAYVRRKVLLVRHVWTRSRVSSLLQISFSLSLVQPQKTLQARKIFCSCIHGCKCTNVSLRISIQFESDSWKPPACH